MTLQLSHQHTIKVYRHSIPDHSITLRLYGMRLTDSKHVLQFHLDNLLSGLVKERQKKESMMDRRLRLCPGKERVQVGDLNEAEKAKSD